MTITQAKTMDEFSEMLGAAVKPVFDNNHPVLLENHIEVVAITCQGNGDVIVSWVDAGHLRKMMEGMNNATA